MLKKKNKAMLKSLGRWRWELGSAHCRTAGGAGETRPVSSLVVPWPINVEHGVTSDGGQGRDPCGSRRMAVSKMAVSKMDSEQDGQ